MDQQARPRPDNPLRLMLVDDHPVVRAGLNALLSSQADLSVVCEASDGIAAGEQWRKHQPDVGLIDLSMPGIDGFEVVRMIRAEHPNARLVILTALGGDEDIYRALQAGAVGFLLKDCEREELFACIRAVSQGRRHLQPAAAARLANRVTQVELTSRETEVLQALMEGLSNKRIASAFGVAEGTIKTHVRAILNKLDANSRTHAVRYGLARGLLRIPATGAVGP